MRVFGRGWLPAAVLGVTLLVPLSAVLGVAPTAYSAPGGPRPHALAKPKSPSDPSEEKKARRARRAPGAPQVSTPVAGAGGSISVTVTTKKGATVTIREKGRGVVASREAAGKSVVLGWTTTTGTHSYTARAQNKAGVSPAVSFTAQADADAPSLNAVNFVAGTPKDSRSSVTFKTDPGSSYRILIDGEVMDQGSAAKRTVQRWLEVANGQHKATVQVSDDVGNVESQEKPLQVDIPSLAVQTLVTSKPTASVQVVKVSTTPNATSVLLQVPDGKTVRAKPKLGKATLQLRLQDGTYDDVRVVVRDPQGRRGRDTVDEFQVNTTPPDLKVTTDDGAASEGTLVADVTTEAGNKVTWKVRDSAGNEVDSGSFTADDNGTGTISSDVKEGTYSLQVQATDAYDRTASQTSQTSVAKDPWPVALVVILAGIGLVLGLALLALLVIFARRLWHSHAPRFATRRAEHRQHEAHHNAEQRALQSAWAARVTVVSSFLMGVYEGWQGGPLTGLHPRPGESVRHVVLATLYDLPADDAPAAGLLAHDGALVVTSQRLVFLGEVQQEWAVSDLSDLVHVDAAHTLLRHEQDGDAWVGVAYDDPDTTRLHLAFLLAEQAGVGAEFLAARSAEIHEPEPGDLTAGV